jgi:hypothetical protein
MLVPVRCFSGSSSVTGPIQWGWQSWELWRGRSSSASCSFWPRVNDSDVLGRASRRDHFDRARDNTDGLARAAERPTASQSRGIAYQTGFDINRCLIEIEGSRPSSGCRLRRAAASASQKSQTLRTSARTLRSCDRALLRVSVARLVRKTASPRRAVPASPTVPGRRPCLRRR